MHATFINILFVLPFCLALPMNMNKGDSCMGGGMGKGGGGNGLKDIAAAFVADNQTNPNAALASARLQIVQGLGSTHKALKKVSSQAASTNNTAVQDLATKAQSSLDSAKGGVINIKDSLVAGEKPETADQATVAKGINDVGNTVLGMEAAITSPDKQLSSNIADAITSVTSLGQGGNADLKASNLSLADLGL